MKNDVNGDGEPEQCTRPPPFLYGDVERPVPDLGTGRWLA